MIMNLPCGYLIPVILLKIASCNEIMIPLHERVIVGSRKYRIRQPMVFKREFHKIRRTSPSDSQKIKCVSPRIAAVI